MGPGRSCVADQRAGGASSWRMKKLMAVDGCGPGPRVTLSECDAATSSVRLIGRPLRSVVNVTVCMMLPFMWVGRPSAMVSRSTCQVPLGSSSRNTCADCDDPGVAGV